VDGEKPRAPDGKAALTAGRAVALASACGVDLAVLIGGGVLLGHYVDGLLHSSPWGLLVGLFLGLAAGIYTVYLLVRPIVRAML
jgi:F0F1-type ATP synthase assembly protein I